MPVCIGRRADSFPLLANKKTCGNLPYLWKGSVPGGTGTYSATSWCFTIVLINACAFNIKSDRFLSCANRSSEIFLKMLFITTKTLQSSVLQPKWDILPHNSLSRCQTPTQNSREVKIQAKPCCNRHPNPPWKPSQPLLQPSQDFSVEIPNIFSIIFPIICLWKTISYLNSLNCSLNCTSTQHH